MPDDQRPPATLIVFSDDWGRHPSSCQHLIRRLVCRHRVLWVNTIGTRRPHLDAATLRRGWEKSRQWLVGRKHTNADEPSPAPVVLNPAMWPWMTRHFDRTLNSWLLSRQLNKLLSSAARPVIAVTTVPIVADLIGRLNVDRWVYYCVDDFTVWPGRDHGAMREMDQRLIRRADVLVAAGVQLQDRLHSFGQTSALLTSGVDLAMWRAGLTLEELPALSRTERPLITFWGLIDRRLDTDLLRSLSERLTSGTIVLIGPTDNPDPKIFELPRVIRIPPLPYSELPRAARMASALIMPYADLPVTRAMQPLKMLEYLAAGKPVIAPELPACQVWRDAMDVTGTNKEFVDAVLQRLETGLPETQAVARRRLDHESWDAKASQFEQALLSGLVREPIVPTSRSA